MFSYPINALSSKGRHQSNALGCYHYAEDRESEAAQVREYRRSI